MSQVRFTIMGNEEEVCFFINVDNAARVTVKVVNKKLSEFMRSLMIVLLPSINVYLYTESSHSTFLNLK